MFFLCLLDLGKQTGWQPKPPCASTRGGPASDTECRPPVAQMVRAVDRAGVDMPEIRPPPTHKPATKRGGRRSTRLKAGFGGARNRQIRQRASGRSKFPNPPTPWQLSQRGGSRKLYDHSRFEHHKIGHNEMGCQTFTSSYAYEFTAFIKCHSDDPLHSYPVRMISNVGSIINQCSRMLTQPHHLRRH